MFLGQNKYIYGRFEGNMDTINTSTESGGPRTRLNVSTRKPTEVTAFFMAVGLTVFDVEVEV
jgi:hypothetical protein